MSSGIDGGISGGGAAASNRKNTKKFGKNLNKLTKAPAAPPVPVISAGGGGASGSFRGSSSNRNGLLLLSTKSKSSSGIGGGSGGLLASSNTPKTAHDALLLSAGAGQEGGDPSKRHAAHAWGIGEKKGKEPVSLIETNAEKSAVVGGNEKSEPVVDQSNISTHPQRPLADRSDVNHVAEKLEAVDMKRYDSPMKVDVDKSTRNDETLADEPISDASQPTKSIPIFQPTVKTDIESKKTDEELPKVEKVKDYQVEYMSKLAKERAEKLRLEEEARMAAQKERAAMRLRELEEKRLEERKKILQIKSQERKELAGPSNQVILEPLGKLKKDAPDSSSHGPMLNAQLAEKKNARTLYDPDRPFSSLVGGKAVASVSSSAIKDERPLEITKKPLVNEPPPTPLVKHGEQASIDSKKNEPPPPAVHMVQLSNLDEIDRGGRGEGQGGPRMLFDPSSGSMVAVKSREDPKSTKKPKQKVPQKAPAKSSEEVGKVISRRASDGVGFEASLRGKQGKGSSRKDEPPPSQQKVKKSVLDKVQPNRRKRFPRTCGVLYKLDKSGNYLNADGCNPDNGYGAHLVPGGRVKNPGAHAKLLKQREEKKAESQPSASINATEGFSFRNDPGFIRHQTDFEAQQQRILEDAWASLIENDEPMEEEADDDEEFEDDVPASKSGEDEYAAALAISPSMIGLNFDTIDNMDSVMLPPAIKSSANRQEEPIHLVKFAIGASSNTSVVTSANPFVSPLSLWGASTPGATNTSYGDLGALTSWTPIPFGETDTASAAGSAGLNGSSSQASKLHLWGSSALDDGGLGAFGKRNGAD